MRAHDGSSVLIVDDEPAGLLACEAVLTGLGANVVSARSGRQALQKVLREDFAVILLDVRMPGMDGFETAELIRERDRSRTTPIIFLTAFAGDQTAAVKGYGAGAVDFLLKPVNPDVLRSKVDVFLQLGRKSQELRQANESLQRRTSELAAANAELEAFSYSVSHDLRAPLRSIDGFSAGLAATPLDESQSAALARIRAAVQRMDSLIGDLLELARVTRRELEREPVAITAMAREIAAELRREEPGRTVDVHIADGLTANADPGLLRIVLQNLLGNALKFTSATPDARVEVGGTPGGREFFVRDNGVGFPPSQACRLFRPFSRLHATAFPGTGIGLATVQRIVRRHGGRVNAEGNPGAGAIFRFTLDEDDGLEAVAAR